MSDTKHMHDIAVAVGLMVDSCTLTPDLEDLVLGAKSLRRRYEESKTRVAELESYLATARQISRDMIAAADRRWTGVAQELERLRRFETHARAADAEEYVGETCEELRKAVMALDEAAEMAAAQPSGEGAGR